MEVTKSNFNEVLPLVKQTVEDCDFLAIDTELTGLTSDRREHAFDTMEERYWKLCENSRKFLIIQFGVSCFKYHADAKKYTHKDFNFYTFPRPHSRQAPDPVFMCQPSSLHYLTSHGFDFNKLVNEGITYLTPQQELKLRNILKARHEEEFLTKTPDKNGVPKEQKTVHIPDEQRDFIKDIHKRIDAFIADDSKTIVRLPVCSGYQRKLIYQTTEQRALVGLELGTCQNENKQSYIAVTKVSDEEKLERQHLKQLADIDELNEAVGFRKVLEIISASQKLVLGHNMLLDILHTVNQFYYPLPDSLHEFKDMTKHIFPRLMDTKTLASSPVFKDCLTSTALPKLFEELKEDKYGGPPIEAADETSCYSTDMSKMHEAGFDAFVTGFCFIKLASMLEKTRDFVSVDSITLSPYINRPFIMRHYDVCSLNLHGPDPEPNRDHVFYVSFPKEWKTIDLVELFLPYGGIYVSWLGDTSALIALKVPDQTINVKRGLLKELSNLYKVKTYAEYRESELMFRLPSGVENVNRPGHPNDPDLPNKRRRSGSGGSLDTSLTHRTITPIPEEDEVENNASDKQENLVSTSHESSNSSEKNKASYSDAPKAKKQKVTHDESETNEVTSTEKLFEEPSIW